MADNSISAVITDPPYGMKFMGNQWDYEIPGIAFWRETLRVAKPGAHLLTFGGTRTWHRLACVIEDAGWEIRDTLMWLYGQGFPKSLDISKAMDKALGTKPVSALAKTWAGFGTSLKPAWEPIMLCRKPISEKNVQNNVLRWGTGALNIDGCRVPTAAWDAAAMERCNTPGSGQLVGRDPIRASRGAKGSDAAARPLDTAKGRWPANVILDETAAELLDSHAPRQNHAAHKPRIMRVTASIGYGGSQKPFETTDYGDGGSLSRFFYCAKTSRAEREAGLEDFPAQNRAGQSAWAARCKTCGCSFVLNGRPTCGHDDIEWVTTRPARNCHPTVKPVALLRYLVRLIAPPGGIVLDMFAGSGSTGIACIAEGFPFVLIEQEPRWCDISAARIRHELSKTPLFTTKDTKNTKEGNE
jgi:site-specific DNA-methyltransferase (adenine-specific)